MADTKLFVGGESGGAGDLSIAANWRPPGVPVDGDFVHFRDSTQDVDSGVTALSAVTPGSLTVHQSFEGLFGTPAAYVQMIMPPLVEIGGHQGEGNPVGSKRIKLQLTGGSSTGTVIIHNSETSGVASAAEQYLMPVRLLLPAAGVNLEVRRGRVSVAAGAGETSTLGTLRMLFRRDRESDARVVLGSGVTLTTIEKHGGKLEADFDHAVATILQTAGVMLLDGTAAVTTLSGHGGKIVANLTGTITNVESYGADLDFMQSQVARIVTNLKTRGAGAIAFDPDVLTITNWLPQEAQHFQHTAA